MTTKRRQLERATSLTALVVLLLAAGAVRLAAHITPVVILRKQADVIRRALPDAAAYSVTTVDLGQKELRQIQAQGHFTPDVRHVKFYWGKNTAGERVGTVVFPQIDTPHGPLEAGVAISPDGRVTDVEVTRATVETKPWVLDAEKSGVVNDLTGETLANAKQQVSDDELGGMPGYMADAVAKIAYRALVLRSVLLP